ncbi:sensor histidine kinase [Desulfovibrio inopinatus]|uniref:sensor histidine kinase n=1 Tax=Desulfovibrio inopinatus TaxID=102109 RepID=UPI000427D94F|nr:HAMP domain-containing sensor histidine kinase [Desulfovibrio inopinatus]
MPLLKRLKKNLLVRLIVPLLLLWTLSGILFFSLIDNSIVNFLDTTIENNLHWLSRDVLFICTKHLDQLTHAQTKHTPEQLQLNQAQALEELAVYFREHNIKGIIAQHMAEGYEPLHATNHPHPNFSIPDSAYKTKNLYNFSLNNTKYYTLTFLFSPWKWRITLINDSTQFTTLNIRVHRIAIAASVILCLTALLMILLAERFIRHPIQNVIASIRKGEKPHYTGVEEIEYLSTAICEMMSTLEDQGRTLEAKVADRTRDLAAKAEELERANSRLTELDTMKSVFLSSVSHELRTPLTSILGFAKISDKTFNKHFGPLYKHDPELAKRARVITDNLAIIHQEGERLRRLINDVLDLNRIESGRLIWKPSLFSVRDAILESVEVAQNIFTDKPVELKYTVADRLPYLYVDRDRFMQVMHNLIENAAKFTPQGEVEVIAHESAPGVVRVQVKDTGTGIAPEELSRVFNLFHQSLYGGDITAGKPTGSGLGLSICKQIIEHYGGVIWAESTVGNGSIFTFELQTAGRSQDVLNKT